MKNVLKAITAVLLLSLVAMSNATPLNWNNLDGAGTPTGFILIDTLNTVSIPQNYVATINLGSDNIFNVGDTFSQTLDLVTSNAGLEGDYRIHIALNGFVYYPVGGDPIVLNSDNSVTAGWGSTYVELDGSVSIYNNVTSEHIADVASLSGETGWYPTLDGPMHSSFTVVWILENSCGNCDAYLRDAALDSIVGEKIGMLTMSSASVLDFNGSNARTHTLVINSRSGVQYTGDYSDELFASFPVDEPGTLALLGLGLIGMGFMARRRT